MPPNRLLSTAAASMLLLIQGCQPVMSNSTSQNPTSETGTDGTAADWPFRFKRHNFGDACYSTYGCKIVYDNHVQTDQPDDELSGSSESLGADYPDNLSGGYLGVQNFPPPAVVTWRSKDGSAHEAEIDMAAIFRDELVLHKVPKNEVGKGSIGTPEIILEVNDRTINVYMRTRVPTKELQIPGNQHSLFRDDLILAFSKTY